MAIDAKAKPAPTAPKPRVSPGEFVRQVRVEFAKVTWPSRRETITTTIMVLIMTAILSVFFIGVDQVLGRLVKFLLSLAA
ncbi:MAG: preprotein translocase subunit SecE [Sandarakinorhabdus sp.]|jgi:preprotein translocase subunit SecE|nr:preprotein translocase subunit SecE [Sandarakinorhabdus sp.]